MSDSSEKVTLAWYCDSWNEEKNPTHAGKTDATDNICVKVAKDLGSSKVTIRSVAHDTTRVNGIRTVIGNHITAEFLADDKKNLWRPSHIFTTDDMLEMDMTKKTNPELWAPSAPKHAGMQKRREKVV